MFDAASILSKLVLDIGYDAFTKNKDFKYLKISIKEQLKRELKLNLELIDEFYPNSEGQKSIEPNGNIDAFRSLKTTSFESIAKSPIPLSVLLSEKFNDSVFSKKVPSYTSKSKGIQYLHQLLERTYFRLEVAKAYSGIPNSKMDIGYLKFLIRSCVKALT